MIAQNRSSTRVIPRSRQIGRLAAGLLGSVVVAISGFVLWPSPIDPQPLRFAASLPLTGVLAPNDALRNAEQIGVGRIYNPEDVAFDSQGRMYVGNRTPDRGPDGQVLNPRIERVAFAPDGSHTIEEFVTLPGGNPLDLRFDRQGNLLVASWGQGLISISPDRQITTLLADETLVDGKPFGYADGIAVASDGKIYVTQGTDRAWDEGRAVREVLEGGFYGRLLVYDPATGTARTLIPELTFGNGVALAPDESYVLVADQYRYRIKRFWLTGEKVGTEDVFMDNLPGFVHNIFLDDRNVLWIAIYRPRNPLVELIAPYPWVRAQVAKLPPALLNPAPNRDETLRGDGFVMAVDTRGTPLMSLHNPPRALATISTAVYPDGHVYIGTITGGPVLRYLLNERPRPQA